MGAANQCHQRVYSLMLKWFRRLGILAAIAVALYGCQRVAYPESSNRVKLEVTFEVDGELVTESGVMQTDYINNNLTHILIPIMFGHPIARTYIGEAIPVDLKKYGYLYILLPWYSGDHVMQPGCKIGRDRRRQIQNEWKCIVEVGNGSHDGDQSAFIFGPGTTHTALIFSNGVDYNTAKYIKSNKDLIMNYGGHVKFVSGLYTITDDKPTKGRIEKLIPWLNDERLYNSGEKSGSILIKSSLALGLLERGR